MSKDTTRDERLAAKLRENLRRRKNQGKALASGEEGAPAADADSPGLSNPAAGR